MTKLVLDTLTRSDEISKLNSNFDKIETALEKTLWRDGSLPNSMDAILDMNDKAIINLPAPTSASSPLRLGDLFSTADDLIGGPQVQHITATEGQTVFTLTGSYVPNTNTLYVYRNGIFQTPDSFIESSTTVVTMVDPMNEGDILSFVPAAISSGNIVGGGGGSVAANTVTFTPYNTLSSTNVQAAIQELLDEIPTNSNSVYKIAVVGDSFTCNPNWGTNWINYVTELLERNGINFELVNFSAGGLSFYRAQSALATYQYFNGKNVLAATIAYAPDLAIVSLGYNDAITAIDSRSSAQINTDATSFFSALKTAVPNVYMVFAEQFPYDTDNFTAVSSLKNKQVLPTLQTGMLDVDTGSAIAANLENTIDASSQTKITNWNSLKSTVEAFIPGISTASKYSFCPLYLHRPARLGLIKDGIHLSYIGQKFIASMIWEHLRSTVRTNEVVFAELADYNDFTKLHSTIWNTAVSSDGTGGWTYLQYSTYHTWAENSGIDPYTNAANWFKATIEEERPSILIPGTLTFSLRNSAQPFSVQAHNCPPNTAIDYKLNGGAWNPTNLTTNEYGEAFSIASAVASFTNLGIGVGTHTFQYKCGSFLSKVYTVTINNVAATAGIPKHGSISYTTSHNSNITDLWIDTGIQVAVTPTFGPGRLIRCSINCGVVNDAVDARPGNVGIRLLKNGSVVSTWNAVTGSSLIAVGAGLTNTVNLEYFDSESRNTAVTYKIQFTLQNNTAAATAYINGGTSGTRQSTMFVIEADTFV